MDDDRLWCYWLCALALGFRRGEGLGMRWADIDLEARTWEPGQQVQRQRGERDEATGRRAGRLVATGLKTEASGQKVAIPRSAARALAKWQADQKKTRLAARRWAPLDFVFTTGLGTALEPRNVNRAWERLTVRAGVPGVRLHDLRHACGSYLVAGGVNVKTVQRTLRHARMSTTIEMYIHAIEEVPREAADAMDDLLDALRAPRARREAQ